MIQRRAAHLHTTSNYCYSVTVSSMLKSLGWPTLQQKRSYLKFLLPYKILKAMVSISFVNLNLSLSLQEDTNNIFNACKLTSYLYMIAIATIFPLFHLQLDYGIIYQLMLSPSLAIA